MDDDQVDDVDNDEHQMDSVGVDMNWGNEFIPDGEDSDSYAEDFSFSEPFGDVQTAASFLEETRWEVISELRGQHHDSKNDVFYMTRVTWDVDDVEHYWTCAICSEHNATLKNLRRHPMNHMLGGKNADKHHIQYRGQGLNAVMEHLAKKYTDSRKDERVEIEHKPPPPIPYDEHAKSLRRLPRYDDSQSSSSVLRSDMWHSESKQPNQDTYEESDSDDSESGLPFEMLSNFFNTIFGDTSGSREEDMLDIFARTVYSLRNREGMSEEQLSCAREWIKENYTDTEWFIISRTVAVLASHPDIIGVTKE